MPGADRIRSLTSDDDVFRAFDSYPWAKDKSFLVRCMPPHAERLTF